MYLLLRKEREEVYEFITEQLRKKYIRPSKSLQTALVFFCRKEGWKKAYGTELYVLNQMNHNVRIMNDKLYFVFLFFLFYFILF